MKFKRNIINIVFLAALMLPQSSFAETLFNGFSPLTDTFESVKEKLNKKNLKYTVENKTTIRIDSPLPYAGTNSKWCAQLYFDDHGKFIEYFQPFNQDGKDPEDLKSVYQHFARFVVKELKENTNRNVGVLTSVEKIYPDDFSSDNALKSIEMRYLETDNNGKLYREVRLIWYATNELFSLDVIYNNNSKWMLDLINEWDGIERTYQESAL